MGEEEFWLNQHTMPVLFHNHPDGFAYAREETDRVDEKVKTNFMKFQGFVRIRLNQFFEKSCKKSVFLLRISVYVI